LSRAEGEGFEPSIRLTTDNGFEPCALCGSRDLFKPIRSRVRVARAGVRAGPLHQRGPSDELATGRPLEVFKRRGGGRFAGGCKLLGRQFGLEPRERRARGEGVGRGELLVTQREREDRGVALFRVLPLDSASTSSAAKSPERVNARRTLGWASVLSPEPCSQRTRRGRLSSPGSRPSQMRSSRRSLRSQRLPRSRRRRASRARLSRRIASEAARNGGNQSGTASNCLASTPGERDEHLR
jgi:hypothetical protein